MSPTTRLRIAVFGIGPSGLAAAHAFRLLGADVTLFSRDAEPSKLYGCQYLHGPLQDVDVDMTSVRYQLIGTPDMYRAKVYGAAWQGEVSPGKLPEEHLAWDLRATYKELWFRYLTRPLTAMKLVQERLNPIRLYGWGTALMQDFDLIVSTVPARALCADPERHNFAGQEVWANGDAPELGVSVPVQVGDDTIICNGDPEPSWYRASRVFGHTTAEWPDGRRPPVGGIAKVTKPLWTNCDCFPWIQRLGRYGSWRKGILVHDVYEQARQILSVKLNLTIPNIREDLCLDCGRIAFQSATNTEGQQRYRCFAGHSWSRPARASYDEV